MSHVTVRWLGLDTSRFLLAPTCLVFASVLFAVVAPRFWSLGNASSMLNQALILALLSVGQMFAIATRGFDLSVGAAAALVSAAAAMAANSIGLAALLIAPALGLAIGVLNGLLVGAFGLQAIVATLGTLVGLRALSLAITDEGQVVPLTDAALVTQWGFRSILGLPPASWIALALIALAAAIAHWTTIGRRILMLGSNPDAATLVGIGTTRTHIAAYGLCGALAGCAGLLMTVRAGAGLPMEGAGMELQSIAAALIGGAALQGGMAPVVTVMLGAAFIQVLLTGLNLLGISPFVAEIAVGSVLIGAGLLEFVLRRVARIGR